jgi:uncharacterized pyridoxal phosphate-containing UPF0001 family protein
MIEIKLSTEETKGRSRPVRHSSDRRSNPRMPEPEPRGLMTMPPWSDEAEPSRPYFRRLRELAEAAALPGLSMGMSHDFEVAIEEGATHIRVGTALFGRRRKT